MRERTLARTGVIVRLRRSPLGPYLDHLATSLHHEGYAPSSIQRFLCAAEQFAHGGHGQGSTVCEMEAALVPRYSAGLPTYRSGNLPKAAQGLGYLVRFLYQHGVARPPQDGRSTPPLEPWLRAYDAPLAYVAGFALRTRQGYGHLVRRFLSACVGAAPPDWPSLTAATITTFVRQETSMRHNAGRKQPAVAGRSFRRVLVFRGDMRPGLAAAAPSPPQWQSAALP